MIFSTPYPPEEGIGAYVRGLSTELMHRGHEVTCITRGNSLDPSIINVGNMPVVKTPFIPAYPFHVHLQSLALTRTVRNIEHSIDILHIHSPLSPIRRTVCPVISTFHTMMLQEVRHLDVTGLRSTLAKLQTQFVSTRLEKSLINASARITAVSNEVRESMKDYGADIERITVVHNGVDINRYSISNRDRVKGNLVFVGRLDLRKGIFDLIKAATYVDDPDMRLKIVGKGPLEPLVRKRIKALNLQKNVELLGHVSEDRLIELYQTSEAFILPSLYEGLPTVLLEAMACGAPCISTSVGGVPEVLHDHVDGLLIPPGNPMAMADAIRKIQNDRSLQKKLGQNARKLITSEFSWTRMADRFISLYEMMLCDRRYASEEARFE